MIPNFFNLESDLEPCKLAIEQMVEKIAQRLYKAGKIKGKTNFRSSSN